MNRYLLFGGLLCREGIGQCRDAVAQRSLDWLAVLEAVLECLMRIVYDVAGRVVIRIVEAEGLRIGHILGLPSEVGKLKHTLPGEEDRALVADIRARAARNIAGP